MPLLKKFKILRMGFQVLLFTNVFVVSWGLVAFTRYVGTHDPSLLEMTFVALATLFFGVAVPAMIIGKITSLTKEITKQAQEKMIKILTTWIETSQLSQKVGMQNPLLWLNVGLTLAEAFTQDSNHPAATLFHEISPMIRKEIRSKLYADTGSKPHRAA